MKFEYHLIPLPVELTVTTILNHLNKLGSDDWELVTIFNGVAYFKRISKQDAIEAEEFMQELTYSAIVNLMNKR